jgi:histidyl-tRNA synthetase
MRGFDYYDGMVFEVFDKHPDNNRAMFGGWRYNGLAEIFGVKAFPAVVEGGAIYCDTCELLSITNTNFSLNTALSGMALPVYVYTVYST